MSSLAHRLSKTSSNTKTNMINTDQFTHIFDSINVSSPIICFQKSTNIYHIDCEKLDINIDGYFSTAYTLRGIWKNMTSLTIDSIFILPYYSNINIIECTINSQNVLRTTSILKHKHIKKHTTILNKSMERKISDIVTNNGKNLAKMHSNSNYIPEEIKLNDTFSFNI